MKIEEGKYYRRRNGLVLGPTERNNDEDYPFRVNNDSYTVNGCFHSNSKESGLDLISEVFVSDRDIKELNLSALIPGIEKLTQKVSVIQDAVTDIVSLLSKIVKDSIKADELRVDLAKTIPPVKSFAVYEPELDDVPFVLSLKKGEYYKRRDGKIVGPVEYSGADGFFVDQDGYTMNGLVSELMAIEGAHTRDLVELVPDYEEEHEPIKKMGKSAEKPKDPKVVLYIGSYYLRKDGLIIGPLDYDDEEDLHFCLQDTYTSSGRCLENSSRSLVRQVTVKL